MQAVASVGREAGLTAGSASSTIQTSILQESSEGEYEGERGSDYFEGGQADSSPPSRYEGEHASSPPSRYEGEHASSPPRTSSPSRHYASSSPNNYNSGTEAYSGGGGQYPSDGGAAYPPAAYPQPPAAAYPTGGYDQQYAAAVYAGAESNSPSNSGEEDEERDYGDGKRAGGSLNGYVSKKRRKQSKPIRLGSDESHEEEGEMEEGEVRHGGGEEYETADSPDDAPLNLSSGGGGGGSGGAGAKEDEEREVGSLRVLGRELLQNPDKDHQGAGMGGGYPMPGSNFGGLPPHFLFPFSGMPGSPGSAESDQGFTPPASHGGKSQIFNIEAYCKLCNKEFCNKYFLKTHMANKHGIYGDGVVASSGQNPTLSNGPPSAIYESQRMRSLPTSMMNVSLPTTPVSISGSFMAMASMRSNGGEPPHHHLNLSLKSPGGAGEEEGGAKSPEASPRSQDASPARMSPKQGPPPLLSSDHPSDPSTQQGEINETNETEHAELLRKSTELNNLPPGLRLSMVPHMNPFGPLPFFNMNPLGPMDLVRKSEAEKREMMSSLPSSLGSPRQNGGGGGQQGGNPENNAKGNMTPDKLRQMGVINADAFCEYCCKEFCNKYFLRVHKLKKHGVCSPELPPEKVQKILAQMAKEAGKTGQPMPPLTLGTPSMIRPPTSSLSDPPKSIGGPLGSPLNLIRHPTLPNFLSLPPLDQVSRDDTQSSSSSDKPDEREEGRPINFQSSPRSMIEPECELKIDESASVIKSPLPELPRDQQSQSSEEPEQKNKTELSDSSSVGDHPPPPPGKETSEGLANLQNMIMKLNKPKPAAAAENSSSSTVCRRCNKDMENKYFLHAHMMNEHGMLNVEDEENNTSFGGGPTPMSISLPQYPADLSKLTDAAGSGLNIPCPIISRPSSHSPLSNGGAAGGQLPKLSEKPLDYPKSLFEQMQGLPPPRPPTSFLEQMKKDLGSKMDMSLSPLKRPSLDRDPNKKPASLSRSYCEICKKELCNKYFMKTHMMKMHGIVMEQTAPNSQINCEICKKEVSSKYFLKVHMASAHGLNEDGSPIPAHMRESGGLLNMFPPLGGSDFPPPPPPPMGEFSRLLMQQGEKNMMKELDRLKDVAAAAAGHICSLCSNTFPDIVALQVHIIKSHGALPPGAGLEGILGGKHKDGLEEEEDQRMEEDGDPKEDADITEREDELKAGDGDKLKDSPAAAQPFGFPLDVSKLATPQKPSSAINDLLARQMLGAAGATFPGLMNPLLLGGGGGGPTGGPANQQFQGLFNMILSEMLKKVQKDTPPQTPPISPAAHHEDGTAAGREEDGPPTAATATRMEEATS